MGSGDGERTTVPAGDGNGDERDLTLRAQEGDLGAFETLMQRYVKRVRAYIAVRAPADHLVDDITHDTFVYAFHHLGDFTAGTALGAWLRAIAGNLLRAEVQRFSRERANKLKLAEQLRFEQAEHWANRHGSDHYLIDALESCLTELPESSAQLIDYRYRKNLSTAEIADATGQSHAWVRTTLFRIRQQLKDAILRRSQAQADGGCPPASD